jgi:hypothetical protein
VPTCIPGMTLITSATMRGIRIECVAPSGPNFTPPPVLLAAPPLLPTPPLVRPLAAPGTSGTLPCFTASAYALARARASMRGACGGGARPAFTAAAAA